MPTALSCPWLTRACEWKNDHISFPDAPGHPSTSQVAEKASEQKKRGQESCVALRTLMETSRTLADGQKAGWAEALIPTLTTGEKQGNSEAL